MVPDSLHKMGTQFTHMHRCVGHSTQLFKRYKEYLSGFGGSWGGGQNVIRDELRAHHCEPENNRQHMGWKNLSSPVKNKLRQQGPAE